MDAETGRAAAAFDDLPDPVWEVSARDLTVRAANAAARRAGIALCDRPERLPTTPDERHRAVTALRAVLRSGRPRRDLRWTLSEVCHTVDLVRVDDDERVRGVLVHAHPVAGRPPLHAVTDDEAARAVGPAPDGTAGPPDHHPDRVPAPGAFRLAVHRVADDDGGADGEPVDWFDTVALGDGRVAVLVGSLPEDGPGASAAVGAVRGVLTAALRDGAPPPVAVDRADAAAARTGPGRGATVTVALLDRAAGTVEYLCRAHCPPVLCDADGARALPSTATGPLGVGAPAAGSGTAPLAAGSALVLASDALVDREGRPVDEGWDELARAVAAGWRPSDSPAAADGLCARVLDRLDGGSRGVLAAATVPAVVPPGLRADVPAEPREVVGARERVAAWLHATGAPADALAAVPIVASELVTNAVQHAYPPGSPGTVRVHVAPDGACGLLLTVSDDGCWAPPADARGFGLAIARELAETLRVDAGPRGTVVRARFVPTRPVVVRDRAAAGPRLHLAGAGFAMAAVGEPPTRMVVRGPVDRAAADDLRSALLYATAGGTRAVVLDLTGVTALGAAAVRVLHEIAGYADPPPPVQAPAESVARAMLEVAGLAALLDDSPGEHGAGCGGRRIR